MAIDSTAFVSTGLAFRKLKIDLVGTSLFIFNFK